MPEDYLSVAEAAEKLSVSRRTIQRYCKQGLLNHKWVQGKRHKELRIIPPIPVSDLPGVKKKKDISTEDFVVHEDFVVALSNVNARMDEMMDRLEAIEHKLAAGGGNDSQTGVSGILNERMESVLYDAASVRPVEKKLILRLAKEIQSHAKFLRSLGMTGDEKE